ncbi:RNA polymerase sigma-54 factor [Leptospira interrogans str. 2003000735]|uniref:RNA polymerase sigma-54 factor n=2 Tax=Leptospira interrogans TaxID=173 RepID=A0A0F6H7R8_LEPIR|nr:RNA polymerase factor sigma-54 [Leptospira interrogans]EMY25258.1 RNA polymerase sigma-54 factor [Leptospira interrogans serovar Australis str. 200703203]EKN87143.1 RNA polymerase sigma-54 factor [Leptospira interrogans str. 2002000624]EKO24280.1 RNA polymerase sigma-54 factor [Leptospira interrogans str. UI 12621]EKO87688.1 RNA polymerase sigma-54 factor [Leptospira interrogans serovar Grippotyphosa str. Andaman]EKP87684.1 RNA polymerase sigma-54 factor [Leptospira interrogans serovar Grip
MNLSQSLVQKQTQKLVMTQDLRQSIELLPLSTLELSDRINSELVENPMLEEEYASERNRTPDLYSRDDLKRKEKNDFLKNSDVSWQDHFSLDKAGGAGTDASDRNQKYIESSPEKSSLSEHLLWQLRLSNLKPDEISIGEILISMLDDHGFIPIPIPDLCTEMKLNEKKVRKVLDQIHRLDPIGIGAKDVQETLLIQAKILKPEDLNLHILIRDHIKDLEKLDYKSISKKMEIQLESVESLASEIKKLEPYPATLYTPNKPDYVIPDVIVREVDGEFDIYINDEWIPRLKVNKEYKNILKNAKESDKEYIATKLSSAEWLIRSVNQRRQTLFKVTSAIIEMQIAFFKKGIQHIRPLTLKDIAEKLEMHESTISRITSNKYIQTSRGIMELKWFFSSGVRSTEGGIESSKKIHDLIRNLVKEEQSDNPLSDQEIVDAIGKQGIEIARRTVAKYRKILKILPSSQRKKVKSLESR